MSLLVLLGLCEAGLRIAGHDPVGDQYEGLRFLIEESDDPILSYRLTPGATGKLWGVEASVNEHGLRGAPVELERDPETYRVIALGDSVTFGPGLEEGETWPAMLERRWTERGLKAEVINLGMPGYDARQEAYYLEQVGLAFEPDEVIVCFCVNDVATVTWDAETLHDLDQYGSGILAWSRCAQSVVFALNKREITARERDFMDEEEAELRAATVTPDPVLEGLQADLEASMAAVGEPDSKLDRLNRRRLGWYLDPARVERVRSGYHRLAELSREHGFGVTVFASPIIHEGVDIEAWGIVYRIVRHLAEQEGFRFVDVYPDLKALGLETLHLRQKDYIHLNGRAHREMARVLARETRGWFF